MDPWQPEEIREPFARCPGRCLRCLRRRRGGGQHGRAGGPRADRVNGTPRRHHHHGYDAIAVDEAAVTGYSLEQLRALLHEESVRREQMRRQLRPIRYIYQCPNCGKTYPRSRKYSQPVSCSSCDKSYNPTFRLFMS